MSVRCACRAIVRGHLVTTPTLYEGTIVHIRRQPFFRMFRHRLAMWFVDLDDLPALPRWLRPLAGFRARDHLGEPSHSIRTNVDTLLREHGVDLAGGRVLMLTGARTLGYSFTPLTVYWCHDDSATLVCVVAEVSNTYGERHCYVCPTAPPDGQSPTEDFHVRKEFYVSPFLEVAGHYRMRLPLPDVRLSLAVSLIDHGATQLTAVFNARRLPVRPGTVLRLTLTGTATPQRVIALIRGHGIRLWLRGRPVSPRHPYIERSRP